MSNTPNTTPIPIAPTDNSHQEKLLQILNEFPIVDQLVEILETYDRLHARGIIADLKTERRYLLLNAIYEVAQKATTRPKQ